MLAYDFEEYTHSPNEWRGRGYRTEPFDRHSFNPATSDADRKTLNRLRGPGGSRFFHQAWEAWLGGKSHGRLVSTAYDILCITKEDAKGRVLVDAGCGDSGDGDVFARQGGDARCYDLFPRQEERSFGPVIKRPEGFTFQRQSNFFIQDICERWPDADNSVDYVVSSAVLDLMTSEDRCRFYEEAFRVLKPSGKMAIYFCALKNGHGFSIPLEHAWIEGTGFIIHGAAKGLLILAEKP